tara:strand:+ start:1299 stop:2135 length:837 start_codon:yes stop_codon:yes gene_type:complete
MKKILIIGKNSFIGSNLFYFFKKKNINVKLISYSDFFKKNFFKKDFDYIINCSSNLNFIQNKYNKKFDHDLQISKKIKCFSTKLVLLSTRKIYKPKFNIKENDKKKPNCNYSKNKLASENNSKKILKNKILILRVSNLLGFFNKKSRKLHDTFIDIFVKNIKKGHIYENKKIYKDFISIKKFSEIILKLIKINSNGIYNVSLGKKVYLYQLVKWLNYYNYKRTITLNAKKSFNKDCFTLNNRKLMKKIKINNNIKELKKECLELSKLLFKYKYFKSYE